MTSHPEFCETTTATEVAQTFSTQIRGKNVIITGVGPKSLGESMALSIASQQPALLILASRTLEKLDAVAKQIRESFPGVTVKAVVLDLSSQKSIRRAAEEVNALVERVDVLINNAGIMIPERHLTEDGIELQFGTNHVGPFLFTNLLLEKIMKAAETSPSGETRVVNVTSAGHRISPVRFSDYNFEGKDLAPEEKPPPGLPASFFKDGEAYSGFVAYGQSKTANVLFSVYLTERLGKQGLVSYSVHPGSIWTDLSRHLDEETTKIIGATGDFWKSQDQGAATMLVAAFDPALNQSPGSYLSDCQVAPAAEHATEVATAERLWHLSEELVGEKFNLDRQSRL